jgi:hypothetical protein
MPGTWAFHFTFSVALQRTGKPVSVEVPSPFGPRQEGQSCAARSRSAASVAIICP